jgi:phosphomannomutase
MKCFDREVTLISTDILQQYYQKAETINDHTASSPRPHCADMSSDAIDELTMMLTDRFSTLEKYHQFAVDYSNGAAVSFEQQFLRQLQDLGHRIEHLNTTADGAFTAHHTDTNDPHAYQ